MTNPRRRSNSSSHIPGVNAFKTKFETVEPEPVFEEEIHGPLAGAGEPEDHELEKQSTASSGSSLDDEDAAKKV